MTPEVERAFANGEFEPWDEASRAVLYHKEIALSACPSGTQRLDAEYSGYSGTYVFIAPDGV